MISVPAVGCRELPCERTTRQGKPPLRSYGRRAAQAQMRQRSGGQVSLPALRPAGPRRLKSDAITSVSGFAGITGTDRLLPCSIPSPRAGRQPDFFHSLSRTEG
jgi:hypothetical protein